ncbi:MAG: hypothetical protein JWM27_2515, partial [Gemmatimonadetes bacterium]|nr:hypothetical protein [Gemmatimonadota bacterium]
VPELTLQRGVPRQRDLALSLARTRVAAADTAGRGDRTEAARRGATSQRVITRAEIDRSNATNARQLIEQLRPQWLRARGGNVTLRDTPTADGTAAVSISLPVYLDAQKLGGMSTLADISTTDVELVEFLEPSQAALRFGGDNPRGAIIVTTRAARHVR